VLFRSVVPQIDIKNGVVTILPPEEVIVENEEKWPSALQSSPFMRAPIACSSALPMQKRPPQDHLARS